MVFPECPGVEVEIGGVRVPCLLDTGSHVTIFSETFFQKWLKNQGRQDPAQIDWLTLRAANGLKIPYVGYAVLDFVIGGVQVAEQGVVLVKDECLGAEKGILGMDMIAACWKDVFRGVPLQHTCFTATIGQEGWKEWDRAVADCRKVEAGRFSEETRTTVWLAQVRGPASRRSYCAILEPDDETVEWQVAQAVVQIEGNHCPM